MCFIIKKLALKNKKSLNYISSAKKIQDSVLFPIEKIMEDFPQMFVFFRPKCVVSGDFYWYAKVDNKIIVACVDCIGHGIPGAFLSMIGNTLLNQIVIKDKITNPSDILKILDKQFNSVLCQNNIHQLDLGMDMSLCTIDMSKNILHFSGAKNKLYIIKDGKLEIIKGSCNSVGNSPLRENQQVEFSCHEITFDSNTQIYMLTDGLLDQFSGKDGQKFNNQRFRELLINNANLPMQSQKELLEKTILEWQNNSEQIDDFLVLGIKLSSAQCLH